MERFLGDYFGVTARIKAVHAKRRMAMMTDCLTSFESMVLSFAQCREANCIFTKNDI
jgi:hypothetical protein